MNVIFHAVDCVNKDLLSFADSGNVRPESLFLVRGNHPLPVFGAEYKMHSVLNVCV
jgi:hypothetical protein